MNPRALALLCLALALAVAACLGLSRNTARNPAEEAARLPVVVGGHVTMTANMAAPVKELYLKGQSRAFAVDMNLWRIWKGPVEKQMTLYTQLHDTAACKDEGEIIRPGRDYIFWGRWDKAHQYVLFDDCGGFMPLTAKDAPALRAKLEAMYPPPAAPRYPPQPVPAPVQN
ncbi:MAG: hypothetical protein GC185_08975 [Alphaproteobacteria bacterium]|nr:hypothetical protein [Alphaproteobacteria bacterium]